ncbi:hypothetical protein EV363DRAFT_17654 [Boletus edulis]|nr:hypothetical protein EV363DRAFT_17654 [Boletus edulis]
MPVSLVWGPELIGYTISGFLYGATLGQSICYTLWFPNDSWLTKAFVFMVFLIDTVHMLGSTQAIWDLLVACHQNHSWICRHMLPWGGHTLVWLNTIITFAVQSFYCHRIWTISGKNKVVTFVISAMTILGLAFGIWDDTDVTRVGTLDHLFASPLILPCASLATLCDIFITLSVFRYMWKSGFRRQRSIIQDLALVSINTGVFTCTIAAIVGIMYLVQGSKYLLGVVGMVFARCYVNSMLAVLNARKTIRERDQNVYDLSTIPD